MVMNNVYIIIVVIMSALVTNLYFGYLRGRFNRFSFGWVVCIHAPIPIIVFIRIIAHITWILIPLFFLAAVFGQVVGGRIYNQIYSK